MRFDAKQNAFSLCGLTVRFLLPVLVFTSLQVLADEVRLRDGSRLVGDIKILSNQKLVMDTSFARGIEIDNATIIGISTDQKHVVELKSGDRLSGILNYSEDKGQKLLQTTFGDISLNNDTAVAGIWNTSQQPEQVTENKQYQQQVEKLKEQHEKEISAVKQSYISGLEQVRKEKSRLEDPWSGNIGLGVSGKQGNTDTFNVSGRGEATRDAGYDRVYLYVEGKLEEQNNVTSTNEVLAGAALEHDLTERWFVFGSADFEKDEFENLDLRGVAKAGIGYFFIRELNMFFKGLAGLGYQYESFADGTTLEEGISSIGYDFEYTHNAWWKFGHKLTYFPSLTSPATDYRLLSDLFTELPLVNEDAPWKLRFSIRNDYDNKPRPTIKKLDTSYFLNVIYNFK